MEKQIDTPVLIVGGSLVGLSAAVFLGQRKVPCVVLEKHLESAAHPRAIGYTPRTLELFRPLGISARIPEVSADFRLRRTRAESLAGGWFEETPWTPERMAPTPHSEPSPHLGAAIAQDQLEPMLRDAARRLGADLRLGTELVRFEQTPDYVEAFVRERATGREYTLRASYMIAADGGRSAVREALGIARRGRGPIRTVRSVLFRADLDAYLASGVSQFEIEQPGLRAFLTTYQDGRWVLMFSDDVERDEQSLRAAIVRAIGRDDLPIEILTTGQWELSGLIADTYQHGRVFLAGDAAHTLPPTRGGFGANTGIEDAHNLAWKLESVLSGRALPALLDTYSEERQPIGWLRHQQTFARRDYAGDAAHVADGEPIFGELALEFGQLYRSRAVLGADATLPPAREPDAWRGQPGTRAPHRWIARAGERVSTLDLFQQNFVLLTADPAWRAPAAQVAADIGVSFDVAVVGLDVIASVDGELLEAYGIGARGASLVRPDGYIAWRTAEAAAGAESAMKDALSQVAFAVRREQAVSALRHEL